MKKMSVFVNDAIAFEYDKEITLDDSQLAFLERMDRDMDRGFKINGEMYTQPDTKQRARFVTMNLLKALQQENSAAIAVSCAYLSKRIPTLIEIHARDQDDKVNIELVEES